jgi:hypothetical protein
MYPDSESDTENVPYTTLRDQEVQKRVDKDKQKRAARGRK